jgi:hypothetical protein
MENVKVPNHWHLDFRQSATGRNQLNIRYHLHMKYGIVLPQPADGVSARYIGEG